MSQETEAKFTVSDLVSFNQVKALRELAGFRLNEGEQTTVRDIYQDTEGRALLAAGWALRLRERRGDVLVTAKRLASLPGPGAVHEREELEISITEALHPAQWPESDLRRMVLGIIGGAPIITLFEVHQQRFVKNLLRGERPAAEVSLDEVRIVAADRTREYLELEIELRPDGTRDELFAVVAAVEKQLSLVPSARSKFEEGLLLLDGSASPAFERPQPLPNAKRSPVRASGRTLRLETPSGTTEATVLDELMHLGYRYRVRSRKEESRSYFDTQGGNLFKQGGELYFSAHDSRWHFLRDGRHVHAQKGTEDALPETGPVALSVKALANSAPRVPYLHTVLRETALSLASISGVNLGFTTRVWQLRSPLHEVPSQTVLTLTLDCGQASTFELDYLLGLLKKALGIRELQGPDLGLGLVRLGAPVPGASLPREFLPAPGDEPAVICTKILGGEAWRMKANTPGAIRDLDSEFVHDLRVATRRARFACRLFGGMVGPEKLDAIKAELSWIAGLLGAVRDLDVLTARLESQLTRTDADQAFHANLARVLSERRGHARDLLVAGLGSPRYTSMLELLTSLPSQPEHGSSSEAGKKRLHSDELGRRRIAKALGKIAPWVRHDPRELPAAELHRFRILFKRLRYTAEFFRTIVGDTATTLAKECVRYQDCLGMHQDARVAIDVLIGMAEEPAFKDSRDGLLSLGALIQIQRDTMREIRDQLHELWDSIEGLFDLWAGRAPEVGA